jgi:DNA-binding PadR family transcriptional regulator
LSSAGRRAAARAAAVLTIRHTIHRVCIHEIRLTRSQATVAMTPESFLPLKPERFHMLLTLVDGERHGYAMMRQIAERTGGEVRILPGALYRHLQRMLEEGLIRELDRRKVGGSSDERRRYYAITELGRRVTEAEATRLARLVEYARSKRLVPQE